MNALRIHRRINSDTLHIPELRPLIGKDVEIIVLEDQSALASGGNLSQLYELAGNIDLDFDAIERLREISKI